MTKTLHNSDASGASKNVGDLKKFGDPDAWQLICKASSQNEGWMKSTKAMDLGNGCLVQVTTQQKNPDGSYAVAEALEFVPGVLLVRIHDEDDNTIERVFAEIDGYALTEKSIKVGAELNDTPADTAKPELQGDDSEAETDNG